VIKNVKLMLAFSSPCGESSSLTGENKQEGSEK
jgi:hypothetical protein